MATVDQVKVEKTWERRAAEDLATLAVVSPDIEHSTLTEVFENNLKTAAEIKSVRLKVLLARCLEVLWSHQKADNAIDGCGMELPTDLIEEIEGAIE